VLLPQHPTSFTVDREELPAVRFPARTGRPVRRCTFSSAMLAAFLTSHDSHPREAPPECRLLILRLIFLGQFPCPFDIGVEKHATNP
jgi:hypothetical protein